jgi:hypothetical protein
MYVMLLRIKSFLKRMKSDRMATIKGSHSFLENISKEY